MLLLGRLYQVEYAIEAINHAGACIGILAEDGVVIAAEKKVTSKLLSNKASEKLYTIDDHVMCAVAGKAYFACFSMAVGFDVLC